MVMDNVKGTTIMIWENGFLVVFLLLNVTLCDGFVSTPTCTSKRYGIIGEQERQTTTTTTTITTTPTFITGNTRLHGWFDDLFPTPIDTVGGTSGSSSSSSSSSSSKEQQEQQRKRLFPEQYPATMELSTVSVPSDQEDAKLVRPLLKGTQLESRPLMVAYDAVVQGWNAQAFHQAVDGKGAAIVLCHAGSYRFGGYNPKGWSSNGGARPSVAAFLWYERRAVVPTTNDLNTEDNNNHRLQKLAKVGGGGLACAKDDPDTGIWLGPDGLVIPLRANSNDNNDSPTSSSNSSEKRAMSKLGTYYARGPENLYSLFPRGVIQLSDCKVLVGVYEPGEDIPYSGAVMDMTSG